jgi:hypothetical protein
MSLDNSPPIPLPRDPRHQRFADLVMAGEPAAKAYKEAGFRANAQSRATAASRLLKSAEVTRYMAHIRTLAAEGSVASLRYKRELLFQIMDTPLMAIDPDDPQRKHGRLIKKFKRTNTESGETCEIEKHCPLKAIEIANRLAGEDPAADLLSELAQALMNLPKVNSKM